jgi:hypothetical protein
MRVLEEEQPDGIVLDSSELPNIERAAYRVNGFVDWFGDGLIAMHAPDDGEPALYARDLEALLKASQRLVGVAGVWCALSEGQRSTVEDIDAELYDALESVVKHVAAQRLDRNAT